MSRYIDADIFEVFGYTSQDGTFDDGVQFVLEKLDEQPTADVVEVVRCKDCRFRKIEFGWNGKRYKMCANIDYPTDDDAYCSYGERREDGEIH